MPNPNRTIHKAKMTPKLFQLRLRRGSVRIGEYGEVEKLCRGCGEFWPADSEFFAVSSRKPDGLVGQCKACTSEKALSKPRSHKAKQSKYVAPNW